MIFYYARQILGRRLVLANSIVESAQCEQMKGRTIGHRVERILAVFDYFSNFKTIPVTVFISKNRVSSYIKIEYSLNLAMPRSTIYCPNDKHNSGNKQHQ
jgi:hypothetical protein